MNEALKNRIKMASALKKGVDRLPRLDTHKANDGTVTTARGKHSVLIDKIFFVQAGYNGDSFVAEFLVKASTIEGWAGTKRALVWRITGDEKGNYRMRDAMEILQAALDESFDNAAAEWDGVVGSSPGGKGVTDMPIATALRGVELGLEVDENDKGFPNLKWRHVKQTDAELEAGRKLIEG